MSVQTDKSLVLRYFNEVFNNGDLDALEEITAPDFVFTMPTHEEPFRGVDGYKGLVNMLRGCFPDIQFAVEDMVAEQGRVMTRWTARGTHTGIPFPTIIGDVPAAGNQFHIEGMTWHEISGGKIAKVTANEDSLGLITQLGRTLLPGQPSATPVPASPEANKAVVSRYFAEIEYYQHGFGKPGVALDFNDTPEQTQVTERDFLFERIALEDYATRGSCTVIFVARRPRAAGEVPPPGSPLTFVDDSFTRRTYACNSRLLREAAPAAWWTRLARHWRKGAA